MPELTDNQIADLRVLLHRCAALGAELVIIGAIAYQIHFQRSPGIRETSISPSPWTLTNSQSWNADFLPTAGSVSQTVSTGGGARWEQFWT
jgi:hypothetical protein